VSSLDVYENEYNKETKDCRPTGGCSAQHCERKVACETARHPVNTAQCTVGPWIIAVA